MKCPHCLIEINPNYKESLIGKDTTGYFSTFQMNCPNEKCQKLIIELAAGDLRKDHYDNVVGIKNIKSRISINPLTSIRSPAPAVVDKKFSEDYKEACLILTFSPKASAALSRRCLQNILREKAKVKKGDLANEIQEVIDNGHLPSHLIESIDAIRNIGNFAAHPNKSKSTGEIVEVEFGEAEWLLDVIEALFDFYFVQPELLKAKRDALNIKLAEMGKPQMK
ncbi:Phage protein [Sphingobacterium faecium PCAi_F2.5]|nr:Phage protein [Sphingobacterium faecium PCAi_F2.5]